LKRYSIHVIAGLAPAIQLFATEWMPGSSPGMTAECVASALPTRPHAGSGATATKMVHTSLVRLMISRLSFGPM
jgi:hypothetical protein